MMNRAKGGGWEFLEQGERHGFTWSGGSGCNVMDCAVRKKGVCWAEKIVKRLGRFCPECPTFHPHLHLHKLNEPLKMNKPSIITPVSTGDLFGLGQKRTSLILDIIRQANWHTFATLTKAPQNAHVFNHFPENVWFGVSVNEQVDVWRLDELKKIDAKIKWAIFEPLYSKIDYDLSFLDWIIIGAQSRPDFQPDMDWVDEILNQAKRHEIPVYMKKNLDWSYYLREFPKSPAQSAEREAINHNAESTAPVFRRDFSARRAQGG